MDSRGFYSGSPSRVIWIVVNRFQISRLRELVQDIDKGAYIAIYEVADIFKMEAEKA